MTLIPVYKKCARCKKKYSWNPDAGNMFCPNCGLLGVPGAGDIPYKDDKLDIVNPWKKKKKDSFKE